MSNLVNKDLILNKQNYYAATLEARAKYPKLEGSIKTDCCIVGGGLAGLSAAIELQLKGYEVVLLEGQSIGFGSSGRNGGQIIVGYAHDDSFLNMFSPEIAKSFWDLSLEGVTLLKNRIEEHNIQCDYESGYIYVSTNKKKAKDLVKMFEQREKLFNYKQQKLIQSNEVEQFIHSKTVENALLDELSGHFNPLKYTIGLAEVAQRLGVKIYEYSPVESYQENEKLTFNTQSGQCISQFGLLAGNVYTNSFGDILPKKLERNILPVGTYITVTSPLDDALAQKLIPKRSAICTTNFQLDYFRLTPDNRLLFGGDVALSSRVPKNYVEKVQNRMTNIFSELATTPIDYVWGGHVDVTMNQYPDFGKISKNLYYLQGFSGHGVALTGIAGKIVAEAIAGEVERFDLFGQIKHTPFYGSQWMQTPMLLIGMWYNRLKELL